MTSMNRISSAINAHSLIEQAQVTPCVRIVVAS
jgi:hypothetical protein